MVRNIALLSCFLLLGCCKAPPPSAAPVAAAVTPETTAKEIECRDCCDAKLSRAQLISAAAQKGDAPAAVGKTDSPLLGGSPSRNFVNTIDKNIPTDWSLEDKKNVKWEANLGNKSYGGPIVAQGKIFVGTNNAQPRDKSIKGANHCVLMCFNEADGKFLWQTTHEIPPDEIFKETFNHGLLSAPAVAGDKVYYVTTPGEVVAVNINTGKVAWKFDMMKELHVHPHHCCNCSPMVVGDLVYVVTGNGGDEQNEKVVNPKAPSFVAFNKETGKIAWQSNLPGDKIIEGQYSNPVLATINGKDQIIFPGGDAYLYSFEPKTGELLWKFNCHPKKEKADEERTIQNYIIGTPVVADNKVYVGMGVYPEHPLGTRHSYFLCVDATKKGDVSPGTTYDLKAPDNKNTALVFAYGGPIEPRPKKGRPVLFGSTISSCAVADGLVYIPEERGYLHCLDAKTGQKVWDYDFKAGVWGSPYIVDGKVYIATEEGTMFIFNHGREMKIVNKVEMDEPSFHGTPIVANGVLYIMTKGKLYAIK